MSIQLLRAARRACPMVRGSRSVITTHINHPGDFQMDPATRDLVAPKIGNRDVVGFGFNGTANYWDIRDFPCAAIRFGENTPEFLKLRLKEKESWTKLTINEMKGLYRGNFCLTYAEMNVPTSQWKTVFFIFFGLLSLGSVFNICLKKFFYSRYPLPRSITPEWQEAMLYRMVDQRQGKSVGVASKYDYDNKRWKE